MVFYSSLVGKTKLISSFLLGLLIFYPTFSQYSHSFHHHEHKACYDSTLHFHEKSEVCCLLEYLVNDDYDKVIIHSKGLIDLFNYINTTNNEFFKKQSINFFLLRAPPSKFLA